eukprot:4608575-Alexandrium_andersonii.AAC.1
MADASDEVSAVIRFLDREDFNLEELSDQLAVMMSRLHSLFGPDRRAIHHGYTAFVARMLGHPLMWMDGRRACHLGREGGPSDADVSWCFEQMAGWLKVLGAG